MTPAVEAAIEALRAHAVRTHYYCEDSFYSCPAHKDGGSGGDPAHNNSNECMCLADEKNKKLDELVGNLIKELS